jgi:hypothetical protein
MGEESDAKVICEFKIKNTHNPSLYYWVMGV